MSALTNVREKELSPEPNCVILVYVTKEEIDQMKQNQKEQIYGGYIVDKLFILCYDTK